MNGFQDDYAYLDAAMKHPAPLIILAMGMPKQERVAALLASQLDYPCLIVCGGAILDFMGGKVTRAPVLFRRALGEENELRGAFRAIVSCCQPYATLRRSAMSVVGLAGITRCSTPCSMSPGSCCSAALKKNGTSIGNTTSFGIEQSADQITRAAYGLRQTETWLSLSEVKGLSSQSANRDSSSRPASRAMRSHSAGQM